MIYFKSIQLNFQKLNVDFTTFNFFFHLDAYQDQFEKVLNEKKERIAKNEFQRLRNIAKNSKGKCTLEFFYILYIGIAITFSSHFCSMDL